MSSLLWSHRSRDKTPNIPSDHDFLPFRKRESGRAPDVWHFIFAFCLSFMQSRHFLQLSQLICSLSLRVSPSFDKYVLLFLLLFCLLPWSPPSHSSFLFFFPLTLLPIQPEANRDQAEMSLLQILKATLFFFQFSAPVVQILHTETH